MQTIVDARRHTFRINKGPGDFADEDGGYMRRIRALLCRSEPTFCSTDDDVNYSIRVRLVRSHGERQEGFCIVNLRFYDLDAVREMRSDKHCSIISKAVGTYTEEADNDREWDTDP